MKPSETDLIVVFVGESSKECTRALKVAVGKIEKITTSVKETSTTTSFDDDTIDLIDPSNPSSTLSCQFVELNKSSVDEFDMEDEDLLKSASCVVLTFNSSNATSFDQVTNTVLSKCKAKTRHGCVYMIIACFDGITRAVSITEAESFASSSGLFFLEIGIKSGSNCSLALTVLRIRLAASVRYFSTIAAVSAALPPNSEATSPPSAFFLSSPPRIPGTALLDSGSIPSTPLPALSSLLSSSRASSTAAANESKRAREQLSPNLSQQVTELNDLFSLIGSGAPNVLSQQQQQQHHHHHLQQTRPQIQSSYADTKRDVAMSADELSVNPTFSQSFINSAISSNSNTNLTRHANSVPTTSYLNQNQSNSFGSTTSLRRNKPHHSTTVTVPTNNNLVETALVPPSLSSSGVGNVERITQSSHMKGTYANTMQPQKPHQSSLFTSSKNQSQTTATTTTSNLNADSRSMLAPFTFPQHSFPNLPSSFPNLPSSFPNPPSAGSTNMSNPSLAAFPHPIQAGVLPFPLPPLPANFQEQFASIMATHFQSLASASTSIPLSAPLFPFPFPPPPAFGSAVMSSFSNQENGTDALSNLQRQFQQLQSQSALIQPALSQIPTNISTSSFITSQKVLDSEKRDKTAATLDFSSSSAATTTTTTTDKNERKNQPTATGIITSSVPEMSQGWRNVARAVAAIGTIGSIKKSVANRLEASAAVDTSGSIYSGEPFGTPASISRVEKKDVAVSTSPSVIYPHYFSEPIVQKLSDISIAEIDESSHEKTIELDSTRESLAQEKIQPIILSSDILNNKRREIKDPDHETAQVIVQSGQDVQSGTIFDKRIELVETNFLKKPEQVNVVPHPQDQQQTYSEQSTTSSPTRVTSNSSGDSFLPLKLTSTLNSSVSITVSNPMSLASTYSSSDSSNLVSSPLGVISAVTQAASVRIALRVIVFLFQRCIGTINVRRGDSASFLAQRFATDRGMDEESMNALSETLSRAFQAIYDNERGVGSNLLSNNLTLVNEEDNFLSTSILSSKSLHNSNSRSFLNSSGMSAYVPGRGKSLLDEACSPQPQLRVTRHYEEEEGDWEGSTTQQEIVTKFRVEIHPNEPPKTFVFRASDDLNSSVDAFARENGMDDLAKDALFERVREISLQESGNGPPVVAQSTRISTTKAGSSSMPLVQVSKRAATRIITAATTASSQSKSIRKGMSQINHGNTSRATSHTAASRARAAEVSTRIIDGKGGLDTRDRRVLDVTPSSDPHQFQQQQLMYSSRVQQQQQQQQQVKSIPRSVAVALIKRGRDQQAANSQSNSNSEAGSTSLEISFQSRRAQSRSRSETIIPLPPPLPPSQQQQQPVVPVSGILTNRTFVDLDAFSPQKKSSSVWSEVLSLNNDSDQIQSATPTLVTSKASAAPNFQTSSVAAYAEIGGGLDKGKRGEEEGMSTDTINNNTTSRRVDGPTSSNTVTKLQRGDGLKISKNYEIETPKSPGQLDSLDSPKSPRTSKVLSPLLSRQDSSIGFQSRSDDTASQNLQRVAFMDGNTSTAITTTASSSSSSSSSSSNSIKSPLAATLSVEDDDDEDINVDHNALTEAQKMLLQATLTGAKLSSLTTTARPVLDMGSANKTPQTSVMTNEDLQSKLGFQLPPPPPPPSSKKVLVIPKSVNEVTMTVQKTEKGEVLKKTTSPQTSATIDPKATLNRTTQSAQSGQGGGSVDIFEVTGYNGVRVGPAFFNLDVALPGGKKGRILVCKGALPERMAAEFIAVYGLPETVLPKLLGLINTSIAAQEAKVERK